MTRRRKTIFVLLFCMLILTSCETPTTETSPEDLVAEYFTTMQSGNFAKAEELLEYEEPIQTQWTLPRLVDNLSEDHPEIRSAFEEAYGRLEYTVTDISKAEDHFQLTLVIKAPNVVKMSVDSVKDSFLWAFEQSFQDEVSTEDDIKRRSLESLEEFLNDPGKTIHLESTVKVQVPNDADPQTLLVTEDFLKALMGNYDEIGSIFSQDFEFQRENKE
ncbi:MAG TPA: hypothetical protein DHN33_01160 [Eubacteriaceae bacterium]|nr:hypothetical protein [Eubacteriaceae bacterium]